MAGFESRILCSGGGRDDHFATPPGLELNFFSFLDFFSFLKIQDEQKHDIFSTETSVTLGIDFT
jgi:hypothetical protein